MKTLIFIGAFASVVVVNALLALGFAWLNSFGHEGIGESEMLYGVVFTLLLNSVTTAGWVITALGLGW